VVYVLPSNVSKPVETSRMSANSSSRAVVSVIDVETPAFTTPSPHALTVQSEMTVSVAWQVTTRPHPGAASTELSEITLPAPDRTRIASCDTTPMSLPVTVFASPRTSSPRTLTRRTLRCGVRSARGCV
jgi:hypothetical protein